MFKPGVVALAALLAMSAACGDDEGEAGDDGAGNDGVPGGGVPGGGGDGKDGDAGEGKALDCVDVEPTPAVIENGVTLPDSLCDDEKCQVGGCDPAGDEAPACNAWLLEGNVSFQAVEVGPQGKLGLPPPPEKSNDDTCPGQMVSSDADINCCQRVEEHDGKPAIKLTGLALTRPAAFASAAVGGTNTAAIESDRYNWVIVMESGEDGETTITTGNARPNDDGTFTPLEGKWVSGDVTLNQDGAWDAHPGIPAEIATNGDGTRTVCMGPTEPTKDVVMAMWIDTAFDFAQLQLHMTGLQWELPFDGDLICSGERVGGTFEKLGKLHGFLPLDAARETQLFVARNAGSLNLCQTIAGAKSCDGKPSTWQKL